MYCVLVAWPTVHSLRPGPSCRHRRAETVIHAQSVLSGRMQTKHGKLRSELVLMVVSAANLRSLLSTSLTMTTSSSFITE